VTEPTPIMRTAAFVHEIPAFLTQLEELCNSYRIGFEAARTRMVPLAPDMRQVCALADGPSVHWSLAHEEPSTQEPA
jgi:hypothetical protein